MNLGTIDHLEILVTISDMRVTFIQKNTEKKEFDFNKDFYAFSLSSLRQ